jgi:hypothetical protein
MRELNMISDAQLADAERTPIVVKRGSNDFGVHAEHFAEMVRQAVHERYKTRLTHAVSGFTPRSRCGIRRPLIKHCDAAFKTTTVVMGIVAPRDMPNSRAD